MSVTTIFCHKEGSQTFVELGDGGFLGLRCCVEGGEKGRAYAMNCKDLCCAGAKIKH